MLYRIFRKSFRYSRFLLFFLSLILIICLLPGCKLKKTETTPEVVSKTSFYFDTVITLKLYDGSSSELLDECFRLCEAYEKEFSRTLPDSSLYKLNQETGQSRELTPALQELISIGLDYYSLSGGFFDITVAPLSDLWAFSLESPQVPSSEEIKKAREHVNGSLVQLEASSLIYSDPLASLDLGGIAKGYIADLLKEYLISKGVTSAVIDLGGNVLCIGTKPGGEPFTIGIREPFSVQGVTAALLSVSDASVVTSGVYERCFTEEGVFYHHLLNPFDGYPFRSGLNSVTILSPASVDGDALSTICFGLGAEEGIRLVESIPDTYAIFITDDNELLFSKGAEAFLVD